MHTLGILVFQSQATAARQRTLVFYGSATARVRPRPHTRRAKIAAHTDAERQPNTITLNLAEMNQVTNRTSLSCTGPGSLVTSQAVLRRQPITPPYCSILAIWVIHFQDLFRYTSALHQELAGASRNPKPIDLPTFPQYSAHELIIRAKER